LTPLSAIFYGIVQGITEFLPVSSSGHLAIFQNIFGFSAPDSSNLVFDVLLHLATLVAVFIVYWRDIFPLVPAAFTLIGKIFRGKFKMSEYTDNERFVLFVIIATLPLAAAIILNDYVEMISNYTKIIGGILIFNGIVLFISDRISNGNKNVSDVSPRNALIVGLCQICAIVPGLSRSGSTITGGLTQGFTREFAVKFSFILSIPAILGANILKVPELFINPVPQSELIAYFIGMLAAMLSGIAAMKFLIYISRRANFSVFAVYCWIVGIIALIFG